MNVVSSVILLVVAVAVILAIVSMVRRRGRGGCCGDCDKCRDQNNKINRYFNKIKQSLIAAVFVYIFLLLLRNVKVKFYILSK